MISAPAPLTRCAVPYCRGFTRLARRVRFGSYLCYRHQCMVPDAVWEDQGDTHGEQRVWWARCVEVAIERAL